MAYAEQALGIGREGSKGSWDLGMSFREEGESSFLFCPDVEYPLTRVTGMLLSSDVPCSGLLLGV